MLTVLVVSPHFSPTSAPDMQRVRMSLPYFSEFGWQAVVLAADPAYVEGIEEPALLDMIPPDVPIRRVRALPVHWTRKVGVGNLGLRILPFLYRAGAQMIKRYHVDLVYFSTTLFPTLALGRIWKKRYGIPFVLDIQDPWVSHYYDNKPKSERPPKYRYAQRMHRVLEAWTMRKVDGIVAVSESYHKTLCDRYPWILPARCDTIPFGATSLDYTVAARYNQAHTYFKTDDGLIHGVYAGVLGRVMRQTCVAICLALQKGLSCYPDLFSKVRLHFIGTDYARDARAGKTIEPIATEMGLGTYVQEEPGRIPFFTVLNLLRQADFLLVPGSDNPQYTASKIYPYILAHKPLLAVFHEKSSVVEVLRSTQAGTAVTFSTESRVEDIACSLMFAWIKLLRRLPYDPPTNWQAFRPYTAHAMTQRQCELFDRIVAARAPLPRTVALGPSGYSSRQ